ncbi:MAG: replicative DNA helicase [bacterium]|nr:replicative DNA helicase [bacterium]
MTYDPSSIAPYSQDAEEAVLGAVLISPEAYFNIASFLRPEDFFILRHQFIWEAMARLADRNETLDLLTVREELRQQNRLHDIGGPGYLTQLTLNVPTSVHAEVYGRLVERAAVRRRLLSAADEIRGLAMDETLSLDKVTGDAEAKLFEVTERNLRRDMIPMREAISDYFDRLEHLMQHPDEPLGLPTGFKDLDTLLGGLQRSDLLIFAGRPGMGKCVTGDTLIPTEHGLIPIERLKPEGAGEGFTPLRIGVQTPYGLRHTSHFYDSGVKPTLKLQTNLGLHLRATHVHPVLVLSPSGEKVWKPMHQICVGDFVAVQRHAPVWGESVKLPSFSFAYNANLRSTLVPLLPSKMTTDLAYAMGLLVGDGNLTEENYVGFASADPELVTAFCDWATSLGANPKHQMPYVYKFGSIVIQAWLKHLGLSGYAYEKVVPHVILAAPKSFVRAFLQGLFDTDGHAEAQNGHIQFATTSKTLAEQVQILLLNFGVVSRLTYKVNAFRGCWSLRITGDAARLFYGAIGFRLERKQARSKLLAERSNTNLDTVPYLPKRTSALHKHMNYHRYFNGKRAASYKVLHQISKYAPEVIPLLDPEFYWDRVVEVEDGGLQHCYDLTIPDGHAFVGNGIVSHNTSFLLSVALNAAKLGGRILIFTMEMGAEQIVQRFVSMETGLNTQKLRLGQLSQQEWARFVQASGRLGSLPIFIDDTPAMSPLQIRTKSRRIAHEFGLDLVIVDYLQLMTAGAGYENNRVQEISYISRNLKELARELNVPVFSAAQLSRAVESRQDKRPQLSDLRESGCLAGDTQIYLPDTGTTVPIRALVGKTGVRVLALNPDTLRLDPMPITRAFSTGVKPVYKLTTRLGREIRATGNHPLLTIHGWKRLDALAPQDRIAVPRDGFSDVYWDEIASIAPDGECEVFDLTVPGHHNFVANNITVHNSIEQDADIVVFLYRDSVYNEATEFPNLAEVIISKHRNGPTGTINLHFEGSLTKFSDVRTQSIDLSSL